MLASEVIQIISTPLFWIVSAVGSLALGIAGNLLTPKIALLLERRSSSKRLESTKRKAMRMGEILLRMDHPDKLTQTKLDSLHSLLVGCVLMLLCLVIFTLASALEWLFVPRLLRVAVAILGIPVLWVALYVTGHGLRFRVIAHTVEQRSKALEKFRKEAQRTPAEETQFLADWDRKEFGITYDEAQAALHKKI